MSSVDGRFNRHRHQVMQRIVLQRCRLRLVQLRSTCFGSLAQGNSELRGGRFFSSMSHQPGRQPTNVAKLATDVNASTAMAA